MPAISTIILESHLLSVSYTHLYCWCLKEVHLTNVIQSYIEYRLDQNGGIMSYLEIEKVIGREILDSRGNPTVEAEVYLIDGTVRCV